METENEIHLPKEVKNNFVETYSEDMVRVIAGDKEGLVQKIIHEQEKSDEQKKLYSPKSGQNRILLFLSIFLFFFGFWNFGLFYLKERRYQSSRDSTSILATRLQ
jgi:hypothetical protein